MKHKLLILLLLAHLLKELVWLAVIPMWHAPDEEQHFGQVAFMAENNRLPIGYEKDINKEIDLSSELLGTKREIRGTNQFTYHPEYRIPYSNTMTGLYEGEIESLNLNSFRKLMVKQEAARYGPAFYWLTGITYKLFYQQDLFIRLFSARMISVLLSGLTVLFAYAIAKLIFQTELMSLITAFIVGFQPMFSFVSAGVNSDNLFNLIFAAIIYCSIKIFLTVKTRFSSASWRKDQVLTWGLLISSILIGFYTKKQIIICFPIIFVAFLLSVFLKPVKQRKYYLLIIPLLILLPFLLGKKIAIPEYSPQVQSKLKETFFQYIFWHLRHTIAETIPWYWGVFNWLGVTLPRWVNRVQARLLIISTIGLAWYFIKQIRLKQVFKEKNLQLIFLFSAAGIYYFCIIFWDYLFRRTLGFSFGMQGRYFFPTIISHMIWIVFGLIILIPEKFKQVGLKLLLTWWSVYSFIGFKTAAGSYYKLWPLNEFIIQASQYKPEILKGLGLIILIISFLITYLLLLMKLLKFNERKSS